MTFCLFANIFLKNIVHIYSIDKSSCDANFFVGDPSLQVSLQIDWW